MFKKSAFIVSAVAMISLSTTAQAGYWSNGVWHPEEQHHTYQPDHHYVQPQHHYEQPRGYVQKEEHHYKPTCRIVWQKVKVWDYNHYEWRNQQVEVCDSHAGH